MEEGRAPRNRKIKGTKARLLAHSLPSFTGAERSEVEVGGAVMKVPLAPPVPCSLASGTIEVAYASLISVSTERSGVGTERPRDTDHETDFEPVTTSLRSFTSFTERPERSEGNEVGPVSLSLGPR